MDLTLFFQMAGVALTVLSIFVAGFWRMWGLIKDVRSEANLRAEATAAQNSALRQELHEHKLHVAESYVPKTALREVTDQIMDAIKGVGQQITILSARVDGRIDKPTTRTPRA
jgi:hypothetical protein